MFSDPTHALNILSIIPYTLNLDKETDTASDDNVSTYLSVNENLDAISDSFSNDNVSDDDVSANYSTNDSDVDINPENLFDY